MEAPAKQPKPIDRWLTLGGMALGILTWLFHPGFITTALAVGAVFLLLIHPVWKFWWIEEYLPRQIMGAIILGGVLVVIGFHVPRDVPEASSPSSKETPPQIVEIPPTNESPEGRPTARGILPPRVAVTRSPIPKPEPKPKAKPPSLKFESLQLSKEMSDWVKLRSVNEPRLTVPVMPDPAQQRAMYELKTEMYNKNVDEFIRNVQLYYSEHFEDRVTEITLKLKDQVGFEDQGKDCQSPVVIETVQVCANEISAAASKLP
jgi:hypothetical protein